MGLKAVNSALSLVLDPAGIIIALACRGDDLRINRRAGFNRDRLGLEPRSHSLEQQPVQSLRDQRLATADKCCAQGSSPGSGEAAEPAERGAIVKRFGQL